jgi:High-temperature-induced dauer-formation protein
MSIIQVINQLEPAISTLLASLAIPSTRPVLEHLRTAQITGLEPSPVETESFNWTVQAIVWYKSFLWGQIFSSEMDLQGGTVGVWKDTHVRLFRVQQDKAGEGLRGMARDMSAHKVDKMARGVLERLGSVNLGKKDTES